MAKKESTLGNMLMVLLLITFFSSALLGGVHEVTQEPREAAEVAKKTLAIRNVLPDFDNHPIEEAFTLPASDLSGELTVYPGKSGEKISGYAVETYTMKGFSGQIRLMVGLDTEGKITQISVLEQKETPGLGTHILDTSFRNQFLGLDPGKKALLVRKDGGDIDAITAATISSRAFCDAVQRAYDSWEKHANSSENTRKP